MIENHERTFPKNNYLHDTLVLDHYFTELESKIQRMKVEPGMVVLASDISTVID